jgi:hypothetical protein
MTIPTGLGLTRGPESADLAGSPLANRATRASQNDRAFALGNTPDPCYCGCCNMEKGAN